MHDDDLLTDLPSEKPGIARNGNTSPGDDTQRSGATPRIKDRDDLRELRRDPLQFFLKLSRELGDIVQFRAGFWPAYLINNPQYVQQVLSSSNRIYSKDTFAYTMTTMVFGESSLFIADGDIWQRLRRLTQPAFHQTRIAAIGDLVVTRTNRLIEQWRHLPPGQAIDIEQPLMNLTLEIVSQALFSADVSKHAETLTQAITAINVNMKPGFPKLGSKAIETALKTLDEAIYEIIALRHQTEVQGKNQPEDLLAMLMTSRNAETGQALTDAQLRDQIITMFIPAEETTSTALAWTWYLLGQNPAILEKLEAEVFSVLGDRPPTIDDLPKLRYTRMVFDEALRFYPPIWIMSRKAVQDTELGGHRIPANAFIAMSPYTLHRHPAYWQTPEIFNPDHFLPEQVAARPRFAYYPFGGGPRGCMGEMFAITESVLILAMLTQHFRIKLDTGHPVIPDPVYTLRPGQGVRVFVEAR